MIRLFVTTYLSVMLLLAAMFPKAYAGDFWVEANLASYHPSADSYCYEGTCDDFNEFNYGLGLSYEMDELVEWTGGFFRNSYDKNSMYAGIKFKHDFQLDGGALTPGITVGAVTGYDNTEVEAGPLQLMVYQLLV